MASNSMPPRDLDAFVPAGTRLGFAGNRGAAGIDGITSTALGLVTQVDDAVPVVVFTGDLALLHDIGGLLGVERAGQRLTVVCIDNDGGQIFSMLPIHGRIDAADYETIFRTPHGVDLAQLQDSPASMSPSSMRTTIFRPCFRPPAPRPSQVSIS